MFVPRKHPFGNDYHSISCGACIILFAIELVEGKDRPPQKEKEKFEERGEMCR